jgi:ion channel-forming bestrophin family protein
MLMQEMGQWIRKGIKEGKIDSITQTSFDHNLNGLSNIVGGCERIAGTPIPFTYKVLLHRTVYLYCFLLPFGLVDSIGWMTPVMVVFIAYTFMALDAIVNEIEGPFGVAANDLGLNAMSSMIETRLREMAGESVRPSKGKTGYIVD